MHRFDYRMVEGPPLCYYQPYATLDEEDRFLRFHTGADMNEDILMPASPNSTQSDSENSLSSIEVPQKELRLTTIKPHESNQCRWRSCGIFFPTLDLLANHVSSSHATSGLGGMFYCDWEGCTRNNKGFNARYKMLVHVRTHTNEKPHRCRQCDKSFSRAENLKIHSRSHSGEKPYTCPAPGCGKAYSNSSDRFKHSRTHQVGKPYQCKVAGCPKRYTDPSSLRKHVKTYKHVAGGVGADRPPAGRENVIKHPCRCSGGCCAGGGGLGSWGRYVEQGGCFGEGMQVDVPLDLSLHRRGV